ncbi:MAG: transporter substrate-binding domain-containing protein [Streptococcaceae bacterium]|jgi:polar amino acid transport system substrate-binding protein|nr:transporter substrate-binding domain-containing protein [Streptococcaceae bacterium]
MKKLIALAALAASLVTLAACSGTSSSSSQLKKIQDKGTIVVATNAEFAPFEFQMIVNGKNTIVGSDIDLANEIGKELGVKVQIDNMDFNNVLASVQSGKADLALAGLSANAQRKQAFDFSSVYYQDPNLILIKKANLSKFTKISDFDGKQVTAQTGSIQEGVIKDQMPKASEVSLTDNGNIVTEVQGGQVAAAVLDGIVAKQYVDANPDLAIANVTLQQSNDGMGIAMKKNSGDLLKKVNDVIAKLKASGWITKDVDKNIALANKAGK